MQIDVTAEELHLLRLYRGLSPQGKEKFKDYAAITQEVDMKHFPELHGIRTTRSNPGNRPGCNANNILQFPAAKT